MYPTSSQRSLSVRVSFQEGIGPRPLDIFQNSDPSVSMAIIFASVKFAGLTLMVLAPGPSPRPFSPWQSTQLSVKSCSASAKVSGVGGNGFFTFFASSGATQGTGGAASCAAIRPNAKLHIPITRQAPIARANHKDAPFSNPLIPMSPVESRFGEASKILPQDRTYFTC